MQKIIIAVLFVFSSISFSNSQNIIDSLSLALKNCKKDTAKIQILNELALKIYNTNPELCSEYANMAFEISLNENYKKHFAKTLNALAVASWATGNYDKSLEYLFQKLKIHEKNNDKYNIASTYRNIAIIYKETERYQSALDFLNKSLEISEQENYEKEIADIYNMLGVIYNDMNQLSKAKMYWQKAINIFTANNQNLKIAYVKNNLGQLYKKSNQYDSALILYNESLIICKNNNDNWSITKILQNIANIHVKRKNLLSADNIYKNALDTAIKYQFTNLEMNTLHSLAQLDTIKKDYKSAFKNYTKYVLLKDSLFSQEKDKTISELEIKYETKNKEQENQLLKKSKKIKSLIIRTGSIILILAVVLLLILWRLIHMKRKTNIILNLQNKEIAKEKEQLQNLNIALKENKEKYDLLANNITDFIWMMDLDMKAQYLSPSIKKFLGFTDVELTSISIERIFTPQSFIKVKETIAEALKTYKSNPERHLTVEYIHKEGWIFPAEIYCYIISDSNGNPVGFGGVSRNISEQKKAQEELLKSKKKIEIAHKEITDNIKYAKTIQNALLTRKELIDGNFDEYFLLFLPKDQVSGDFYYINKISNNIIFAVADCTGHGVPGGLLTMLGITYLHEIVRKEEINNVGIVLNKLRQRIKSTFTTFGSKNHNGLDIALCSINIETNLLQYAGAYNPLWIIRNNKLKEFKATRNPIGFYNKEVDFEFNEIQLQNNDMIYIFSDGFHDQIGGERNKKFMIGNFRNLIFKNHLLALDKQKIELDKTFIRWKSDLEQVDDITIMGIKWNIQ